MDSNRLIKRFVYLLGLCAIIASLGLFARPTQVMALSAGQISFSLITPFMLQDSNNSCVQGPKAMYIQIDVTNTSGTTLTNLSANINAFAGAAGVTLDSEESPTRYIGTLAPGGVAHLYYYINYACQAGSNPPPLSSTFTVTISDSQPGTVTSPTLTVTTRSELSANAGGQVTSATLGAGAVVGQIIPYTVVYDFGNAAANGVAMIQPAGNVSFDSGCYRLLSVDVNSVVNFTQGLLPSADNRLYFPLVNGGASNGATVTYYFIALCSGGTGTTAKPFSDLTSGGQIKYTGNYNTFFPPTIPAATMPAFLVDKRVSPTIVSTLPANVTYTVLITNTSPFASRIDKITDTLPAPLTFQGTTVASAVTSSNSSGFPAIGSNGTMNFTGMPTTTCTGSGPITCDGSYLVPAGGSIKLIYTVTIPAGTPDGYYTNYAAGILGSSTVGQDLAVVKVGNPPTAVTMASFAAYATSSSIKVQWRTSAESKVAGFNIYRATSTDRASATKLNSQLIDPHGASIPYVFNDTSAETGVEYWYWIEIVNDGEPNQEVGPTSAQIAQQFTIFMPFLSR